jgi:hypothetical protein
MSTVTVSAAGKIAALDALLALINGGSGDSTGDFQLQTAAAAALATLTFSATSFAGAADVGGTIKAAANTITASGTPTPGTIGKGVFRNKANTAVITFDIDTSGTPAMTIADKVIPADATSVSCSGLEVSLTIVGA